MSNALTREVGFKVGPVLLEVLAKHYLDRRKKGPETTASGTEPKLRQDDILYDEAFTIVKSFLNAASMHTVEELQAFSNTRTPSPPWIRVVRTLVPMSSCDDAASYLTTALGGESEARRIVGGVKWWQVRGISGVDAQWITAKKDWQEAKRRHKIHRQQSSHSKKPQPDDETNKEDGVYEKDMDAMRCILYLHGGGYYFGSVDQERYSIQRLARKINGRVFAINYRLAPQYPFPCALQDALAAYLFLIRPPPESEHKAVNPAHIIITGDSAGGGLSLALLQVIRDSDLPLPSGGLLISPWCDLTHSFPSIHLNTDTDIISDCGLSFHKPSILWPPPPPEISNRVHASLRHRIRQAFRMADHPSSDAVETIVSDPQTPSIPNMPVDVGTTTSVPHIDSLRQNDTHKIHLTASSGEHLEVEDQIHFYAENALLVHPLVSPALSYLGGLPPLFFIASDKEVLRDEIIYAAHKAANPSKYPVKERSRDLYPVLNTIKEMKPTSIHLQVYDDTAHILPILFSFTTPAKFCFRAMATFCKFVTNMPLSPPLPSNGSFPPHRVVEVNSSGEITAQENNTPSTSSRRPSTEVNAEVPDTSNSDSGSRGRATQTHSPIKKSPRKSLRRALSSKLTRATSAFRSRTHSSNRHEGRENEKDVENPGDGAPHTPKVLPETEAHPPTLRANSTTSSDVGGPRFNLSAISLSFNGERFAGEPSVYTMIKDHSQWDVGMIRERVSTLGVIRPLETETDLDAFRLPPEVIGSISELALRRYMHYRGTYAKKFAHNFKSIEKHRRHNLERAKEDTIKQMSFLRQTIKQKETREGATKKEGFKEYLLSSPGWSWAWALDLHEEPPPSSIVSRRDTDEARKLAEIADQAILGEGHAFSGNNLWSVVINFLTVTPGKTRMEKSQSEDTPRKNSSEGRHRSRFSRILTWEREKQPQTED